MTATRVIIGILAFWALQVVAQLLFKWGSDTPGRWAWGFVGGNIFGMSSIVFLMLLYKTMNANVALGLCLGGGFLMAQVALAVAHRSGLGVAQHAGIIAITAGMILLAVGKPPPA